MILLVEANDAEKVEKGKDSHFQTHVSDDKFIKQGFV